MFLGFAVAGFERFLSVSSIFSDGGFLASLVCCRFCLFFSILFRFFLCFSVIPPLADTFLLFAFSRF